MLWDTPLKTNILAEKRLIDGILDGHFPVDSKLPAERELAQQLGITRPTLREALQRLASDGWIDIQHGKSTRIRNYWQEGNLAVLASIAERQDKLPSSFIENLLSIRILLSPAYVRLAIEHSPSEVADFLRSYIDLPETPDDFAAADWQLHLRLSIASNNPIFTLILNGFSDLYPVISRHYFIFRENRDHSRTFYTSLSACALRSDAQGAEVLTRRVMSESLELWKSTLIMNTVHD